MPTVKDPDTNEEFEILDVTKKQWVKNVMGDLTKASAAKQTVVGGISGWFAGYIFCKVGKAAAVALGGSLLVMQIAIHRGYIKVNWNKVDKELKRAKKDIRKSAESFFPNAFREAQDFARENLFLAGGFAGGFLVGLAT